MTKQRQSGLTLSNQAFFILASLAAKPKHGYAIAKEVLELTDGRVKLSAATLYENISRLLDEGLIERCGEEEIEPGERRKLYQISGEGATVLNEQWRVLERTGKLIPQPIRG